jgi:RNA ligase (TIGR02306 family)
LKSTQCVEIVPVEFSKHPDADNLSIAMIHGGYSYVGRTEEWLGVTRAAYIPPDNLVDATRPEFAFLREKPIIQDGQLVGKFVDESITEVRIKAKKLRGVLSFGLMIPVPADTPLGEDWTARLGVRHYEPPTEEEKRTKDKLCLGGDTEKEPDLRTGPYYDIDAGRRYGKQVFVPGEPVWVTEKLDGSNCRVVWHDGRLWVKSREHWKRRQADFSHLTVEGLVANGVPEEKAKAIVASKQGKEQPVNGFWQVVEKTPGLVQLCQENPGTVVFGEIFGSVNAIKYGLPEGNRFAAFDVYRDGRFLDGEEAMGLASKYGVPWAPLVKPTPIPFDFDVICQLAEGPTLVQGAKPKTIREGVVVRPAQERFYPRLGRVALKWVSGSYLDKYR